MVVMYTTKTIASYNGSNVCHNNHFPEINDIQKVYYGIFFKNQILKEDKK